MKILRYLNRDVLTHTLAISAVLLVIIFSGRFSKYLAQAAAGDMSVDILLPVMIYRMPGFLELIVPLSLFIGILMAYGRLYMESEMVVMSACGISQRQLALYTLVPALLVAGLVGLLSLYVTPLGAARSQALLEDPKSSQGLSTLAAGRFQARDKGSVVTYTESMDSDSGVMKRVFVSQLKRDRDGKQQMRITVAQEGDFVTLKEAGVRYFELRDGYSYEGLPGSLDYQVTSFKSFGELIPELEGGVRDTAPVDGRPTAELLQSNRLEDRAALQWRLSMPLMVPIVAVIAMCLSKTNHRRGRYVMLVPGLVLYLLYLMALIKTRSALENAELPLLPGVWMVHGAALLVALGFLYLPDWLRGRLYVRSAHAQG